MLNFSRNVLEVLGIVYLRFRMVPRVWCVWLVGVNAACLFFNGQIEAQVVLAVTGIAVAVQAVLYGKIGFTRIMGVAHVFWIPMFAWMAMRIDTILMEPGFAIWIAVLFATNLVSIVIDAVELVRFARGDRAPSYRWKLEHVA